jgi:hypothetical protein
VQLDLFRCRSLSEWIPAHFAIERLLLEELEDFRPDPDSGAGMTLVNGHPVLAERSGVERVVLAAGRTVKSRLIAGERLW